MAKFFKRVKKDNEGKEKLSAITVAMLVFLIVYSLILLGLLLWAFMTSFKSNSEFRLNKIGLPKEWVWNYSFVFNNLDTFFFKSISLSIGTLTCLNLIIINTSSCKYST